MYHHLELHSQATRLVKHTWVFGTVRDINGVVTLSDAPFQKTWIAKLLQTNELQRLQFNFFIKIDSHVGLFPVRSPLLGESSLISFPPLSDMLKFSGCSCLSSGHFIQGLGRNLRGWEGCWRWACWEKGGREWGRHRSLVWGYVQRLVRVRDHNNTCRGQPTNTKLNPKHTSSIENKSWWIWA